MILGPISWLDCFVFILFLAPQLYIHVGFVKTAVWLIGASPFLTIQLPYRFICERFFTSREEQTPFVQRATPFQDFVIRCVRYAFANLPAFIGRVFLSKEVSLPFLRFRMLRHGYLSSPIPWHEIQMPNFRGIWIISDETRTPDIVVYYCHGGGFSMGSSYFFMEFLLAWVTLLNEAGFGNPALFALEYSLVPDAVYPTQAEETLAGYKYVLSIIEDPSKVCVSGDSAGATLILSMLLSMSNHSENRDQVPGLAVLISPWVTIITKKNKTTQSDYLNQESLHLYGSQYLGTKVPQNDPIASPGHCGDPNRWKTASPSRGWCFVFGSEEVLASECRNLIARLRKLGIQVDVHEEQGSIHAWPVATLYLGTTKEGRLHELRGVVNTMKKRLAFETKENYSKSNPK